MLAAERKDFALDKLIQPVLLICSLEEAVDLHVFREEPTIVRSMTVAAQCVAVRISNRARSSAGRTSTRMVQSGRAGSGSRIIVGHRRRSGGSYADTGFYLMAVC
jgi:hypothetical protein